MLEKKTRHSPVRVRDPGSQGPCPLSFSCLIRCQGRPPKEQLILHRRRHQSLQQVWHHQSVKRRRSGASKPYPLFRLAYCRRDTHTHTRTHIHIWKHMHPQHQHSPYKAHTLHIVRAVHAQVTHSKCSKTLRTLRTPRRIRALQTLQTALHRTRVA